MVLDIFALFTFLAFAAFGAIVRELFGLFKAYNTYPDFRPEWKRISVGVIASMFFGTFGAVALGELGVFEFALTFAAMFGGLLGSDTIRLITKRFGLGTKELDVIVSRQQMKYADLNERQVRALDYAKKSGKITNRIYQKINSVGHDIAKRDLNSMLKSGRIVKLGSNRDIFYSTAEKPLGDLRADRGTRKTYARKMTQKTPSKKMGSKEAGSESQREDLRRAGIG